MRPVIPTPGDDPRGRPGRGPDLTVVGQQPAERADAARNRRKVLDAAVRLAEEQGVSNLQMDEVARVAGVGVGTIYRRFGDRAGLVIALVDHDEQQFQQALFYGPPPLGPGAPARERIEAFLRTLTARIAERGQFLLVAECAAPHARFSGAYTLRHMHLTALLAEAAPRADAPWLADALLAPLAAVVVTYQLEQRGMTVERIADGVVALLDAALATGGR